MLKMGACVLETNSIGFDLFLFLWFNWSVFLKEKIVSQIISNGYYLYGLSQIMWENGAPFYYIPGLLKNFPLEMNIYSSF